MNFLSKNMSFLIISVSTLNYPNLELISRLHFTSNRQSRKPLRFTPEGFKKTQPFAPRVRQACRAKRVFQGAKRHPKGKTRQIPCPSQRSLPSRPAVGQNTAIRASRLSASRARGASLPRSAATPAKRQVITPLAAVPQLVPPKESRRSRPAAKPCRRIFFVPGANKGHPLPSRLAVKRAVAWQHGLPAVATTRRPHPGPSFFATQNVGFYLFKH